MMSNGVALTFHGKRSAKEMSRKARPRVMRREPRLTYGSEKGLQITEGLGLVVVT